MDFLFKIGKLSYIQLCIYTINFQIFLSVVFLVTEDLGLHGLPCLVILKLHCLQVVAILPFIYEVVDNSSFNRNTTNENILNPQTEKLLIVCHGFCLSCRRLLISFCLPHVISNWAYSVCFFYFYIYHLKFHPALISNIFIIIPSVTFSILCERAFSIEKVWCELLPNLFSATMKIQSIQIMMR